MSQTERAADAILALIQEKLRLPTKPEIAELLEKVSLQAQAGPQQHRAEWKAIAAEHHLANARCSETSKAASGRLTDVVKAAEEEANEVQRRLYACARKILKEPVRSMGDLNFLAEVCQLALWTDEDLAGRRLSRREPTTIRMRTRRWGRDEGRA
jgi:hypothetical protein